MTEVNSDTHEVIHGLVDVAVFKNWWIRVLVVTFELICIGFVVYQSYGIVRTYSDQPITTFAFMDSIESFPTVTICPRTRKYLRTHFEDPGDFQELAKSIHCRSSFPHCIMGFKSLLYYLMSLEFRGYAQTLQDQRCTTVEDRKQMRIDLFLYLRKMNMTPSELELSLTADFDDIILEERHAPIKNKLKHITVDGACYSFDFDIHPSAVLKQSTRFDFRINRSWDLLWKVDSTVGVGVDSDALFLGDLGYFVQQPAHAINQGSGQPYKLPNGGWARSEFHSVDTTLYVASRYFKRVNRRSQPCRTWTTAERGYCAIQCYNQQFCSKLAKPCNIPQGNETMEQAEQLCSWLDGDVLLDLQHCVGFREIWYGSDRKLDDICNRQCPPLCEETVYYVTRGHEDIRELVEPNYSHVQLRFEGPASRFGLIEKLEFSSLSLACEIGSAVALWTGSTLINIGRLLFHGIQFLMCRDK